MGTLVRDDIVPLFVVENSPQGYRPVSFLGTGFIPTKGVLVTCWHVVRDPVAAGREVAAVIEIDAKRYVVRLLSDVQQDPEGFDLATARVPLEPRLDWRLFSPDSSSGIDVFSYGYPLTIGRRVEGGRLQFDLQSRYIEGYVTRPFIHQPPSFPPTPSYELDMLAPAGLSGAPLIFRGSMQLMGVVYGAADSYSIAEESRADPDTGEVVPEVRRIISFGLATFSTILGGLRGAATGDEPLRAFIPGQAEPS